MNLEDSDPVKEQAEPSAPEEPPAPEEPVDDPQPTQEAVETARKRDSEAQKPENSWVYRNINPIMGLLVVSLSYLFYFYIIKYVDFDKDGSKKDIIIYLMGSVSTLVTMVIGYYFGSSKGSSDKAKQIERITK